MRSGLPADRLALEWLCTDFGRDVPVVGLVSRGPPLRPGEPRVKSASVYGEEASERGVKIL